MGSKSSTSLPSSLNKQNWVLVTADPSWSMLKNKPQQGSYTVYRNIMTNDEIQQYAVSFANDEDYQKYLRLFHWRESQDEIVNARYIFVHSNEECCSSLINGQVYVENIPIRLVNIEDIPYPENLYVLQSSLDGFKKLREWAGFFKVVEDMVCIDRNGKVKTWVNTDLSLIQVPRDKEWEAGLVDEMHLQDKMVTDIVHLIDRSTDHETEPDLRFLKYFNNANKNGLNSFHSAHKAIKDYASLTGAKIPNYFQSLLEMMHENDESDNADHTEEDDKFDVAPPAQRNNYVSDRYADSDVHYYHNQKRERTDSRIGLLGEFIHTTTEFGTNRFPQSNPKLTQAATYILPQTVKNQGQYRQQPTYEYGAMSMARPRIQFSYSGYRQSNISGHSGQPVDMRMLMHEPPSPPRQLPLEAQQNPWQLDKLNQNYTTKQQTQSRLLHFMPVKQQPQKVQQYRPQLQQERSESQQHRPQSQQYRPESQQYRPESQQFRPSTQLRVGQIQPVRPPPVRAPQAPSPRQQVHIRSFSEQKAPQAHKITLENSPRTHRLQGQVPKRLQTFQREAEESESSQKIIYSDSTGSYQLDQELVSDMIKYLGKAGA